MFALGPQSLEDSFATSEEALSQQPGSPEALDQGKNDSEVTIVGFWKRIELTGGLLTDIGFNQFSVGGTELLNDSPPPATGNNICMGAWKRIGARTYTVVHPFFVFDDSGKKPIAISIERTHLTVSRDGNTFAGRWHQDNYDFSGNVLPGTHFEGTTSGTRISPGLPFPFPFPQ